MNFLGIGLLLYDMDKLVIVLQDIPKKMDKTLN